MKALVYHGPGQKKLEEVPKPALREATDAVVRVIKTTICGTDLHILKGDLPTVAVGRILGHEGIGVIEEAGASVTRYQKGDRVLISCITACEKCEYCRRIANRAAGFWATPLTARRRSSSAFRLPTRACIPFPRARTRTRW